MNTNATKDNTAAGDDATARTSFTVIEGKGLSVDDILGELMEVLPMLRAIKRNSQTLSSDFEAGDAIWRDADRTQRKLEALIQ